VGEVRELTVESGVLCRSPRLPSIIMALLFYSFLWISIRFAALLLFGIVCRYKYEADAPTSFVFFFSCRLSRRPLACMVDVMFR